MEEMVKLEQGRVAPINNAFASTESFEAAQRMGKMLASLSFAPDTFKGKVAECVIALEMANRIGMNVLAVMQNLYLVHGRPAWSSQFLISCINSSGRFSPLRYEETGIKGADSWGCRAWAQDKSGERLEGPEITIAMAKAEGWFSRNGSKWKSMPELMLHYRAATVFARLYAPELTMGMHTDDEIIDVSPVVTETRPSRFESAPEPLLPAPQKQEPKTEQKGADIPVGTEHAELMEKATIALEEAGLAMADADKWARENGSSAFKELPMVTLRNCVKNPAGWIAMVRKSREVA